MLEHDTPSEHLSSFDLDLLELGGLDDDKKRALDEHLRACPACQKERESLRKLRAEFSAEVLPRTVERIRDRIESKERSLFARPTVFAPLLASAAALVLWVASGRPGLRGAEGDDDVRAKGASALQIVARQQGRLTTLDDQHRTLSPGDEVRFVVTAPDRDRPFLLIASVDGAGKTSIYFPYEGIESGRVDHPGRWEVPGSIVLDDSRGPERVFALFSKEPLTRITATHALGALGQKGWEGIRSGDRLDLGDVEQTSFLIEKSSAAP